MKTPTRIHQPAVLCGSFLILLVFFVVASSRSAAATEATVTEPKTHTLFMGADFDLQVNGEFCRVQDVSGESFVVGAKGSERPIAMGKGTLNIKVQDSLKLTEASATIAKLKGERAYTPANDPTKKFMNQQPGSNSEAMAGMAAGAVVDAAPALGAAQGGDPMAGGGAAAAKAQLQSITSANVAVLNSQSFSEANNIGNYVGQMQRELALELFDAMEVTFAVSSEKPLPRPYVVIVARYHEKDATPGKVRNWIFAKALAPIGSKPQKVHVLQGGFPPGFVIESFNVHLFDRGQELATNVADKRVELTYSDAFRYFLFDYISSHKGASLPAAPVMGQLPSGWHTRLTPDQLTQSYFVKVSKDGMPLGAYADEACSQSVTDPYLQSVVKEILFAPTLDKGKAVAGTAKLRLGDIRI
jgi:hypothetical protein